MHLVPRRILAGEVPQHEPGGVPAADGKDKSAARDDCVPPLSGDDYGRLAGDGIGIGKDFNLHRSASKKYGWSGRRKPVSAGLTARKPHGSPPKTLLPSRRIVPASGGYNFL